MGKQPPEEHISVHTNRLGTHQVVGDGIEKVDARVAANEVPQIRVTPKEHPLARDLVDGS